MRLLLTLPLCAMLNGCCGKAPEPHGEYVGPATTPSQAPATTPAPAKPAASPSASPSSSAPVPVLRPTDVAEIDGKATFQEAFDYAKEEMADVDTDGKWDRGAYLLSTWMNAHGKWATISSLPETSFPKIMKDSEGERGKRYCETGQVMTIKAFKADGPKMFWGIISSSETRAAVFVAAGDTGSIVDGSMGKFCGVTTGIYNLELKSGAKLPSPKIVGMFDLPTNRKR